MSLAECTARSIAPDEQRLLDFLGEQALAAGVGQRPVLDRVAAGADGLDLDPRRARCRTPRRGGFAPRAPAPAPAASRASRCAGLTLRSRFAAICRRYIIHRWTFSASRRPATRRPRPWSGGPRTAQGRILSNVVLSQDQRACRIRRRGAGNRRPRPCRGARPRHRQGDGRGADFVRRPRRRRGRRRAGADRRRHRRADHGEGDRARPQQAARRRQSPGSACADRAAHRRGAISLLPVSRLRRPHPNPRRARRRRLSAARRHRRRRDRRGVRQDGKIARAGLSRRAAGGKRGRRAATPNASRCRGR